VTDVHKHNLQAIDEANDELSDPLESTRREGMDEI
jgi:hypothetical protein